MQPCFITPQHINTIQQTTDTPYYVYNEQLLLEKTQTILQTPHAFGLTVRYAMKANPNQNILKLLYQQGIHIDASS